MKPVLEVKNLTCQYDRFLLDHVNLGNESTYN